MLTLIIAAIWLIGMYKAFWFIKKRESYCTPHIKRSNLEYLFMSTPSWLVFFVYWYIKYKKENDA